MDDPRTSANPSPASEDVARWESAPLPELVKHLVACYHTPTRLELARIERILKEALDFHGDAHPELQQLQSHFQCLCADLRDHFHHEETVLFPTLLGAPGRDPLPPRLELMMEEHAAASELMDNLRILTTDYTVPKEGPAPLRDLYGALAALEDSLHRHIYLENHVLFTRALGG